MNKKKPEREEWILIIGTVIKSKKDVIKMHIIVYRVYMHEIIHSVYSEISVWKSPTSPPVIVNSESSSLPCQVPPSAWETLSLLCYDPSVNTSLIMDTNQTSIDENLKNTSRILYTQPRSHCFTLGWLRAGCRAASYILGQVLSALK